MSEQEIVEMLNRMCEMTLDELLNLGLEVHLPEDYFSTSSPTNSSTSSSDGKSLLSAPASA